MAFNSNNQCSFKEGESGFLSAGMVAEALAAFNPWTHVVSLADRCAVSLPQ